MKKIVIVSVVVIILVSIIFGFLYINNIWIFDKYKNIDIEPSVIQDAIFENIDLPAYNELSYDEIKDKYKEIDLSKISSCTIRSSFMNIDALEIGVFKVNDKAYIDSLKRIIEKRAKDIFKEYEGYLYSSSETAKDYEIKVYNDLVIFIVNNNKDGIIKYIEKNILINK